MVAAAKRMRQLSEKLFLVARGPGSVELPKDATLQLKRIYMRVPTGTWPLKEFFWGSRQFWHRELARLKYQNPSLEVEVETIRQNENEPMYLTAEYESSDRSELEHIQPELPLPLSKIPPISDWRSRGSKSKAQAAVPNQPPKKEKPTSKIERFRKMANSLGIMKPLIKHKHSPDHAELTPVIITPEIKAHAPDSTIVTKAQPAASPEEPQTTSPPATIYSRTLTLPLAGMRALDIWNWLRKPQNLAFQGSKPEQNALTAQHQKMLKFKEQSERDRKRVHEGLMRMKNEKAELEKARKAAEAASEQIV